MACSFKAPALRRLLWLQNAIRCLLAFFGYSFVFFSFVTKGVAKAVSHAPSKLLQCNVSRRLGLAGRGSWQNVPGQTHYGYPGRAMKLEKQGNETDTTTNYIIYTS